MKVPSIGKIRGLQQVANGGGTFTVLAMDHRGSFKQMIDPKKPDAVSYDEMVRRKIEMCFELSRYASAALLDPIYGAAQCISDGALPGGKGLLVSIEESGYEGGKEARVTRLLTDWSVEKIKRLGASAVKILVYFRPELRDLAQRQLNVVGEVAEESFDLIVLSVGMTLRKGTKSLVELFRLNFTEDGFLASPSPQTGIFVAGACSGPKDIDRSILHAKSTAFLVQQHLKGRS